MRLTKRYEKLAVIAFLLCFFIKPGLCMVFVGCFVLYAGARSVIFLRYLKKKGTKCIGTIIDYESDSDGDKTPIVEYITLTGDTFTEKPYIYASTDLEKVFSYKITLNRPVPILYDPDNPQKFVIANEEGFNYLTMVVLALAGSIFIGVGISELLGIIHFS